MIFVDSNVLMYAVGRAHPLKDEARGFLRDARAEGGARLCTSAEVLQELLHAYIPVKRWETLDAALLLAESWIDDVWPVDADDVHLARALAESQPALGARDLIHVACCRRRGVARIKTFDRALESAFGS